MTIADAEDVRTAISCLGHGGIGMALSAYADINPDEKIAAAGKIEEAFDRGTFRQLVPKTTATRRRSRQLRKAPTSEAPRCGDDTRQGRPQGLERRAAAHVDLDYRQEGAVENGSRPEN